MIILISKSFVFRAPAWSNLFKGDKVIVETRKGESEAIVEKAMTVDISDEDEFEFILIASGVTLPLKKVLKKVIYREFEYEKEVSEDEEKRLDSET